MRDLRTWILGAFGAYEEEIYVDDKDVVHYTPMEEPYKAYLEYMNRLWSEELLDHESFSQTDDQKKAKAKNNQVGLFSEWHAYFTLGGEPDTEDVLFSPVKSDMVAAPAIAKIEVIQQAPSPLRAATKRRKHRCVGSIICTPMMEQCCLTKDLKVRSGNTQTKLQ